MKKITKSNVMLVYKAEAANDPVFLAAFRQGGEIGMEAKLKDLASDVRVEPLGLEELKEHAGDARLFGTKLYGMNYVKVPLYEDEDTDCNELVALMSVDPADECDTRSMRVALLCNSKDALAEGLRSEFGDFDDDPEVLKEILMDEGCGFYDDGLVWYCCQVKVLLYDTRDEELEQMMARAKADIVDKKMCRKGYRVKYSMGEDDEMKEGWYVCTDEELAAYNRLEAEVREEFLDDHRSESDDPELWQRCLEEAYMDAGFETRDGAAIHYVDMKTSSNYYWMKGEYECCMQGGAERLTDGAWVGLTDEEYCELRARCMMDEAFDEKALQHCNAALFWKIYNGLSDSVHGLGTRHLQKVVLVLK